MPILEDGPFYLRINLVRQNSPNLLLATFILRVEEKEHVLKWSPDGEEGHTQELQIKAKFGAPDASE